MMIELPSDLVDILAVDAAAQKTSVQELVCTVLWTSHELDLLKTAMRIGPDSVDHWGTFTPKPVEYK